MGLSGKGWAFYLVDEPDLDMVQRALSRERVIRQVMVESGEDRQTVTDMADAMESMGQEAVLSLTEGEPTTLRDALQRYVDGLDTADPQEADVAGDLGAILNYPWPDMLARIEGKRGEGICNCGDAEGDPVSPRTGREMDHHCDCMAVTVAGILAGDRRRTKHVPECGCDFDLPSPG